MKKLILALAAVLLASSASASDLAVEMGTGIRWEQKSAATSVDHQGLFGLGLNYGWDDLRLTGEFTHFTSTSEEASFSVERSHYEFMGWLGYEAYVVRQHTFLISGGLGFFWENVLTEIGSLSSESSSGLELLVGLAAVYKYQWDENWGVNFRLGLVMNTNNSLAPVADTLLRVSYDF